MRLAFDDLYHMWFICLPPLPRLVASMSIPTLESPPPPSSFPLPWMYVDLHFDISVSVQHSTQEICLPVNIYRIAMLQIHIIIMHPHSKPHWQLPATMRAVLLLRRVASFLSSVRCWRSWKSRDTESSSFHRYVYIYMCMYSIMHVQ